MARIKASGNRIGALPHSACWRTGSSTSCTFFLFPLAMGSGPRLFADGEGALKLELAACEAYDTGAVHLAYRTARRACPVRNAYPAPGDAS